MFTVVRNMQAGTLQTNVDAGCLQMPESCGIFNPWYQVNTGVVWVTELPSLLLWASCCPRITTATACQAGTAIMCNTAPLALLLHSLRGERETERTGLLDTLRAGDPFPLRAGLTDRDCDLEADLL